jgi:hypothetical protein
MRLLLVTALTLLAGCTSIPAKHESSEISQSQTLSFMKIEKAACDADKQGDGMRQVDAKNIAPVLVPALLKFGIDAGFEYKRRELERLRKRAAPAPIALWSINGSSLALDSPMKEPACYQLRRRSTKPDDQPRGIEVKIRAVPALDGLGVRFEPVSIAARDSRAFAAASPGEIAVGVSIAVHALDDSGRIPRLALMGSPVMQFHGVKLPPGNGTPASQRVCNAEDATCESSEVMPLPKAGTKTLVSVGLTEIGNAGIDIDLALKLQELARTTVGSSIVEVIKADLAD